jgi:cytochrome c peroxidase
MRVKARSRVYALALISTALLLPALVQAAAAPDPWLRPAQVPYPPDNAPNAQRISLGRTLFFDPRLSGSGFLSCATCHNPGLGWSDGLPTGIGHDFKRLGRATPTVLNAAFQPLLMWDGRKPNLEAQALGPIESAGEMNMPLDELVKRLSAINGYHALFDKAYPGEGISTVTVGKAIASFERTVVSTPAPFDRWRKGNKKAISADAERGFALFNGKAACVKCHQGFNFTDNGFHNIGVKSLGETEDEGRFAHRKIKILKGAFKTPTLRDIELTAPYMHNGMYKTLEDVVEHYDRGGDVKTNLSPNIQPLGLSAQEKQDLVAFMKSLTGTPMQVAFPQLPPN